jgi:putative phage-type endonuclease
MSSPITREEWLEARRYYLGGTDMANIVGYGFGTALDVYRAKVLGHQDPPSLAMRRGIALEPLCRELYLEESGNLVQDAGTVYHPEHLWCACNPDDYVGTDGMAEYKTYDYSTSAEWGPKGSTKIPRKYRVQVQWNLWITGRKWCDVGAFHVSNSTYAIYRIDADLDVGELLYKYALKFRNNHWIPQVPPCPTGKDWDYIKSLYPTDMGEQFDADDDADEKAMRWRELVLARKPMDEEIKHLKTWFMAYMGDRSLCTTIVGNITYRTSKNGRRVLRNEFEGEEE